MQIGSSALISHKMFQRGAQFGRMGKGNIFVFSSGDGGRMVTCGLDGYLNSIYTFMVSGTSKVSSLHFFSLFFLGKLLKHSATECSLGFLEYTNCDQCQFSSLWVREQLGKFEKWSRIRSYQCRNSKIIMRGRNFMKKVIIFPMRIMPFLSFFK